MLPLSIQPNVLYQIGNKKSIAGARPPILLKLALRKGRRDEE
jgi:hypothetical protein